MMTMSRIYEMNIGMFLDCGGVFVMTLVYRLTHHRKCHTGMKLNPYIIRTSSGNFQKPALMTQFAMNDNLVIGLLMFNMFVPSIQSIVEITDIESF